MSQEGNLDLAHDFTASHEEGREEEAERGMERFSKLQFVNFVRQSSFVKVGALQSTDMVFPQCLSFKERRLGSVPLNRK